LEEIVKKLTVEVTQDDIDRGLPYSSSFGPISRAFHRIGRLDACVKDGRVFMTRDGVQVSVHLPHEAKKFIYNFDTMEDVKPFTFEVHVKDEVDFTLEGDRK
jgi:hypothetical protein